MTNECKELIEQFYKLYPCEWDEKKFHDRNWWKRNNAWVEYHREHSIREFENQFPYSWSIRKETEEEIEEDRAARAYSLKMMRELCPFNP